jgi:CheY-like chemotaxis protein
MAPKVLVVDDDPKWLRVVSLYLRGRDYQVETALNGEEAIKKVASDHPDVVIADIGMPCMDGYELCSRLRQDSQTRTIPFIFLTARDQDTDKVRARKIGSDDYLTKPCPLERLSQSVETVIDRIEMARRLPLDQIGLTGCLDDVDLLDLVQMLELNQKTGALVLSHGERTGTLYFRDGVIVEADIRSPKREEPLFILLGWKTGRFLFLPDAAPEQTPITASMANLLFQDLQTLDAHEQDVLGSGQVQELPVQGGPGESESGLAGRVHADIKEMARRLRARCSMGAGSGKASDQQALQVRILIAGVTRSGKSELIHLLLKDLSQSRWVAFGVEEAWAAYQTDVGRVRISHDTVLHLLAVRAEKRYWPVWEECLPRAHGVLLLVDPDSREALKHAQAFLKARETLAPTLPVHAVVPAHVSPHEGTDKLRGVIPAEVISGSIHDPALRLTALDRLFRQWLGG